MSETREDMGSASNPHVRSYLREVMREKRTETEVSREAQLKARARATRASRGMRPTVKPARISIAGFLFWFPKLFALLTVPPAVLVLLIVGEQQPKAYGTAIVYSLFAVSWALRQGLSRRQWRTGDFGGINQAVAEAARILMWLAVLICVGWAGYTLFVVAPISSFG